MQTLAPYVLRGVQRSRNLRPWVSGTAVLVAKTIQLSQAISAVHLGGDLQGLTERLGRSLANEQSCWRLQQSQDPEQILGGLLDRHVPADGGDGDHLQFW